MARVLVVDDIPANRDLVVTLLRYAGHTLAEAGDGEEALAQVHAFQPAEFIAFIKCDMVSLKGSNACGFHAARTAADNDNIFGCFRFDDPECVLLIRLRVHCA